MGFWKWADAKAHGMSARDVACVKISVFFFALMAAKLFPAILGLEWYTYGAIFIVFGLVPTYRLFGKK